MRVVWSVVQRVVELVVWKVGGTVANLADLWVVALFRNRYRIYPRYLNN